jgi:hypothetical protein
MPKKFDLDCLEKFVVKTRYVGVEADTKEEAEALVKAGKVGYDQKEIQEGDEEFIEVIGVEES